MGCSSGPDIIQDGLLCCLEAASKRSYTSGTTWYDLSGNGNNLTLVNSPTFETDNVGGFNWDASNDYGDFGDFTITGGNNYTICIWLKTGSNGNFENIIDHSAGASGFGVRLEAGGTRKIEIFAYDSVSGTATAQTRAGLLSANTIYHITVIFRTGNYDSFINGTSKVTQGGISNNILSSSDNMLLGTPVGGSYGGPWGGKFYSVAIYDRVLSDEEVRQNYLSTKERFA